MFSTAFTKSPFEITNESSRQTRHYGWRQNWRSRRLHLEAMENRLLLSYVPVMLDDINQVGTSSSPKEFTEFDGMLYFSADDGDNGRELWETDGTAEGTELVADIVDGPEGSDPNSLTVVGDQLYFSAGHWGREL